MGDWSNDQYSVDVYSKYPMFSDIETRDQPPKPQRVGSFEDKYLLESQRYPAYYQRTCGRGAGCFPRDGNIVPNSGSDNPMHDRQKCYDCGRARPAWWYQEKMANNEQIVADKCNSDVNLFGVNIFVLVFMLIVIAFIGYAAKTMLSINSYLKKLKKQAA